MSEIAVIVPVLRRPHRAQDVADSMYGASPSQELIFVASQIDEEQIAACRAAVRRSGGRVLVANWKPGKGDFARKINYAYRLTGHPFLFQAADDVEFQTGWDISALAVIDATETGVCGTNDEANAKVVRGDHSTHSLIRRAYIEQCGGALEGPGTVFSEAYGHQYCDNELVELAKVRECWSFSHRSVVRHSHPMWGTSKMDATYQKGQSTAAADRDLYFQRKKAWEGGRIV